MMSGGPIKGFTKGWAVKIFGFGKAHYYERDELSFARPLCGAGLVKVAGLRDIGTWEKCMRCVESLDRRKDVA
jgi:hypothetical protein